MRLEPRHARLRARPRGWAAVAAAGFLFAGAGLAVAGAGAAGAAVSPPHTFSGEEAGFQAFGNGWHFRYAQAQVTLPDVTGAADTAAFPGYGVSVRLSNAASSAVLGVSTSTGGSSSVYSPEFNLESSPSGSTIGACLSGGSDFIPAGDTVKLSVYFDNTHLSADVTDLTNHAHNFGFTCTAPAGDSFDHAQLGTEFGVTPWSLSPPAAVSGNFRLATLTNTVVTSRTGIRGSAAAGGGWPVQNMVLTSNGLASGAVRASTPFAWGAYAASPDNVVRDGRNFSVWLPSNPDYPTP